MVSTKPAPVQILTILSVHVAQADVHPQNTPPVTQEKANVSKGPKGPKGKPAKKATKGKTKKAKKPKTVKKVTCTAKASAIRTKCKKAEFKKKKAKIKAKAAIKAASKAKAQQVKSTTEDKA